LRALGKVMWGPLEIADLNTNTVGMSNNEHRIMNAEQVPFGDAEWNEKLAAVILIAGIVVIGVAPFLLQKLLNPAAEEISKQVLRAAF